MFQDVKVLYLNVNSVKTFALDFYVCNQSPCLCHCLSKNTQLSRPSNKSKLKGISIIFIDSGIGRIIPSKKKIHFHSIHSFVRSQFT